MKISVLRRIDKLVEKYSEVEIDSYYYDGTCGYVTIIGNPFEEQIWRVLAELEDSSFIENITKITLSLAENKLDDYDILTIDYIDLIKERKEGEVI